MSTISPTSVPELNWLRPNMTDLIPGVSTVTNLSYLILKAANWGLSSESIRSSPLLSYSKDTSCFRCLALLVPFLGNIVVYVYDRWILTRREQDAIDRIVSLKITEKFELDFELLNPKALDSSTGLVVYGKKISSETLNEIKTAVILHWSEEDFYDKNIFGINSLLSLDEKKCEKKALEYDAQQELELVSTIRSSLVGSGSILESDVSEALKWCTDILDGQITLESLFLHLSTSKKPPILLKKVWNALKKYVDTGGVIFQTGKEVVTEFFTEKEKQLPFSLN